MNDAQWPPVSNPPALGDTSFGFERGSADPKASVQPVSSSSGMVPNMFTFLPPSSGSREPSLPQHALAVSIPGNHSNAPLPGGMSMGAIDFGQQRYDPQQQQLLLNPAYTQQWIPASQGDDPMRHGSFRTVSFQATTSLPSTVEMVSRDTSTDRKPGTERPPGPGLVGNRIKTLFLELDAKKVKPGWSKNVKKQWTLLLPDRREALDFSQNLWSRLIPMLSTDTSRDLVEQISVTRDRTKEIIEFLQLCYHTSTEMIIAYWWSSRIHSAQAQAAFSEFASMEYAEKVRISKNRSRQAEFVTRFLVTVSAAVFAEHFFAQHYKQKRIRVLKMFHELTECMVKTLCQLHGILSLQFERAAAEEGEDADGSTDDNDDDRSFTQADSTTG
ncbi:hypothetical protein QFC22_005042 [Naganishia vaughanmartiniae]|uniref:Uncharacterized protein n=1 Tax=Naganishia vaughanmartiniae TaxID=1424756 RepID=A0ACC2WVZ1_9TREE|nr:hypothetical protein QFC22_005042 [Naganishia vaughanmartiniae]